ncbi:DinB family protein [Roseivirga misakiensis]|uniref:DinB superfamily protein n=1 Tax=Roseivirga misakiensis TaxID=1563681 RepID=A0A1E5T0J9_9BACT|nr:DinB family protein [Roseivirga misakiensis]OEK04912.1 DinB superfamily protein [Roseivirga misakiensis]
MNVSTQALHDLFERDLDLVLSELKSYKKEENLWRVNGDVLNSGGNLVLHICGNLRHFIGSMLGGSGYIRQRDDEFGLKHVKKSEMISEIKATKKIVLETLSNLTNSELEANFPVNVFGKEMTTSYFIHHLYGHLNYHLGQLNYHRRLLDS